MKQANIHGVVLADRIFPDVSLSKDILLVFSGALLLILCAQIKFPLYPVPVTGQTFGVLLVAALLGRKRGSASMITYLSFGSVGLPVFANGASGFSAFLGPTAGYLVGFVIAAFLVGWLCEKGWYRHFITTTLSMIFGMLVIYSFGVAWLSQFVEWRLVFYVGVAPFLIGDVLKIALATLILPIGWRFIGHVNYKKKAKQMD